MEIKDLFPDSYKDFSFPTIVGVLVGILINAFWTQPNFLSSKLDEKTYLFACVISGVVFVDFIFIVYSLIKQAIVKNKDLKSQQEETKNKIALQNAKESEEKKNQEKKELKELRAFIDSLPPSERDIVYTLLNNNNQEITAINWLDEKSVLFNSDKLIYSEVYENGQRKPKCKLDEDFFEELNHIRFIGERISSFEEVPSND